MSALLDKPALDDLRSQGDAGHGPCLEVVGVGALFLFDNGTIYLLPDRLIETLMNPKQARELASALLVMADLS